MMSPTQAVTQVCHHHQVPVPVPLLMEAPVQANLMTRKITIIWHEMVNVRLCSSYCVLVKCGNPELTFNDEFPLFTADTMTFPCAELFILQ